MKRPDTVLNANGSCGRGAQRGVSLLFALLALVAMMLAAVALVRSVDSGALVLGNLGFKQEATAAADRMAEFARGRLSPPAFDANFDSLGNGYYATSQDALDPTGQLTTAVNPLAVVDWQEPDSCACRSTTPVTCSSCSRVPSNERTYNGVRTRYLITRLCPLTGPISATNACAKPASTAISNSAQKGELNPQNGRLESVVAAPYYRIIVRSVGSRGTVSFTETIIH